MLAGGKLRASLASIPLVRLDGPWVRCVRASLVTAPPPGAPRGSRPQPLWAGGARLHGGRFTPRGSFDTLYLASDLATAASEIEAVFGARINPRAAPFTTFPVNGALVGVLDLTDPAVRRTLATSSEELLGAWRGKRRPVTQLLGAAAFASGRVAAIQTTSARHPGGRIVAVFVDRLAATPPSFLEVDPRGPLAQRIP